MDAGQPESSSAAVTHRIGQACDRCRKKKLKCDGTFPICRRCKAGGHVCEASTALRRKTKVRGFASDEQRLEQIQAELAKCQQLLQSEKNRNALLEEEIARRDQTRIPQELDVLSPRPAETTATQTGGRSKNDDPAYVIKHMGRLVHDEKGVGRFAGSTTGVHFVLSAEKECQKALNMSCGFPESCFSLFLIHLFTTYAQTTTEAPPANPDWMSQCFTSPLAYYHEQADVFIKEWEAFCPVLVRDELLKDITHLIKVLRDPAYTEIPHSATAMALLMILCINVLKNDQFGPSDDQNSSLRLYIPMASASIHEIAAKGDIKSLQALVLFALYNQLTGDSLAMTRINGLIVNLAQSLGIHRHARRFKMKPGEIELRKRLWWYIYIFDSMTSLLHGLPALINDVDIDNDLPSDCHLLGFDASDISHPLPGENTGVFIFIQYVSIGRIFSRIREMLYTTTKRRNGAAKIQELDLDLRMWIQSLKSDGIHLEIGTPTLPEISEKQSEQTTIWLQLLANFAMILIHRPGLSFDDNTPEFANCLRACVASSSANLALLECSSIPRWLQNLSMNGPGTIFQSALMQAFSQCQAPTITSQVCQSMEGSLNSISKGISILERHMAGNITTNDSSQSVHNQSLAEVIGVLNLLHSLLSWKRPTLTNTEPVIDQGVLDQSSLFFGMPSWSTDGLDVLNYVTATDWAYDIPGPFMGYPDLGVADDNMENT